MNDVAVTGDALDAAVLEACATAYGWQTAWAVRCRLPPSEGFCEAIVEKSLERQAAAGTLQHLKRRAPLADLWRAPPPPGEEPTAGPMREPPTKVVRYVGPEDEPLPPPLPSRVKPALRPATPILRQPDPPPPRRPAAHPLSPAKDQGAAMYDHQELEQSIKAALRGGPLQIGELEKRVKASRPTIHAACSRLAKAGQVMKAEGRLGAWSLINGRGGTRANAGASRSEPGDAELRWAVSNDGSVTFRTGSTAIEVDGLTLERVMRARDAIAEA